MRHADRASYRLGWHLGLRVVLAASLLVSAAAELQASEPPGQIVGRVENSDGSTVPIVRVVIRELGRATTTEENGTFRFRLVPPGRYTIEVSLGDNEAIREGVVVRSGETARAEIAVDWKIPLNEKITVFAASRRRERIVDAPAAVSVLTQAEIARGPLSGPAQAALEWMPGIEAVQASFDWYLLNARGFGDDLNRRALVQLDGRDLSTPLIGTPEWGTTTFPLDDLVAVEFVRGPGSALHGANAFNGVIHMTTKSPADHPGGLARLIIGQRNSGSLDLSHSEQLSGGWAVKLVGATTRFDIDSVSRNESVEYSRPCAMPGERDCLPLEAIPLSRDDGESHSVRIRTDHAEESGRVLTIEAGTSHYEGGLAWVSEAGRLQSVKTDRPWLRFSYGDDRWNLQGYYDTRESEIISLSSGTRSFADGSRLHLQMQLDTEFADDRGYLAGGGSVRNEQYDTADPQGQQTLIAASGDADFRAVFGQLEYRLGEKVTTNIAARWDWSSLHDDQFSPRAALIFDLAPGKTLRASYSQAFMAPNYSELHLRFDVAPPMDLSPFEGFCAPFGVSCGFDAPIQVLALGNRSLDLEEIETTEVELRAVLGGKTYLSVTAYRSEIDNFISGLVPSVQQTIGRVNPDVGPYAPPESLPPEAAGTLLGALHASLPPEYLAVLSNDTDGRPVFVPLSYTNFGKVKTKGVEVGLRYMPAEYWNLQFTYTYFDSEVSEELADDPLVPNTADSRFGFSLLYDGPKFAGAIRYRRVSGHDWRTGIFWGRVPAFDVVKLNVSYRIADNWRLGLDVDNVMDDRHYQMFGSDLLRRRAGVYLMSSW